MDNLLPLALAIPLLMAMVLLAVQEVTSRVWHEALALLAALACLACTLPLIAGTINSPIVYWPGGWFPENGSATGIALIADPVSSGLAALVALHTTLALVFSWHYFQTVKAFFHSLMLMFMAGMVGFCFAGDIFTMFVFFEFISVTAYALTAYKPEEAGPLQGALNFSVVNSIGAFLVLIAIALLYGHTGTLNLAQMGEILAAKPADALVMGAFVLIASGMLVKAAVVPFHFAFADAHAVAPTPVSVLFSGVMIELGLYGVARIYWSVFSGSVPGHGVGSALIALGVIGALAGGIMCLLQSHLKRLLAFSSISHSALFLIGIGLMNREALAGTLVYIAAHGLIKAALFMIVGVILHRLISVSELHLWGRGRRLPALGVLLAVGAVGLCGGPGFGTFAGKHLIEKAAGEHGWGWLSYVFLLSSTLTAGAVLRVVGRVFLGWGNVHDPLLEAYSHVEEPERETQPEVHGNHHPPLSMMLPIALLLALALGLGAFPRVISIAQSGAQRFIDRDALAVRVLREQPPPPLQLVPPEPVTRSVYLVALLTLAAAATLSMMLLRPWHRPTPVVRVLKKIHSGHVGDYVVWLVLGVVLIGALVWLLA
jgi:multicomponent Na+:H+ antiporter subunit D